MATPTELVALYGSPLYVYDAEVLQARCQALRDAFGLPDVDFLFAMKANPAPAILEIVGRLGLGIDAVSGGEVRCALRAGIPAERISFTGNNVGEAEMRAVVELGVHVTVDSLSQLERYGKLFPGTAVGVRINPDIGDGHHQHVITGGPDSKFGIPEKDVEIVLSNAARLGVRIDGVHHHIGSGILEPEPFLFAMDVLLRVADRFPDLAFVDFGGGLGVPYRPNERPFDLAAFAAEATDRLRAFRRKVGDHVTFRFEPGRFVVAECGSLYTTVTARKTTRHHTFIGTDTGFNHLLRPALYDSYHPIRNLSAPDAPIEQVTVAGNICESGDLFARDRALPHCSEGDLLAIDHVGAYGASMASTYNLRERPAEILVSGSTHRLIRRRDTLDDLLGAYV